MALPKVQIVILQYNNSDKTVNCLNSVEKLEYPNFNAVVVDNSSRVDHAEKVKELVIKLGQRFSYIQNSGNLGYSGGNNIGIKYGLRNGADYLLLLNNDVLVPENLLQSLIATAESDVKTGLVAPLMIEGENIYSAGRIKWLKPNLELTQGYFTEDVYISGAALLIKRKLFEKIGFFDERYFLYFEDADFSLRAATAGFGLKVDGNTSVIHEGFSTTRRLGAALLLRYHYRNALLFNRLYGPFWVKILLPFWSIWTIIKQAVKIIVLPEKRGVSRYIISGVIDFYAGRFGEIK